MFNEDQQILSLWQKEQDYLRQQKAKSPEQFIKVERLDDPAALSRIGIHLPAQDLPVGFIKYNPFDFIVEEISSDGELIAAEESRSQTIEGVPDSIIGADLVKV